MVGVGGLWLIATVSGRGGGLTRKMEVIWIVRLRVGGNGGVVLLGAMSVDRRKGLIGLVWCWGMTARGFEEARPRAPAEIDAKLLQAVSLADALGVAVSQRAAQWFQKVGPLESRFVLVFGATVDLVIPHRPEEVQSGFVHLAVVGHAK